MAACELCGKSSNLVNAVVEGTMISVCNSCSKYGNVVHIQEKEKPKLKAKVVEIEKYMDEIIPGYSEDIKKARQQLDMDQKE